MLESLATEATEAGASTLLVPVVAYPPAGARLGDVVYRQDREEHAVNTVLGWIACRPGRSGVPADT